MNPLLAPGEATRVQYSNESGMNLSTSLGGNRSWALDQTTATDGSNIILGALAKIQAAVANIGERQEIILRRLDDLEGTRLPENTENGASPANTGRGRDSTSYSNIPRRGTDYSPSGLYYGNGGMKRKADDVGRNPGKRARAGEVSRDPSNNDPSIRGRGPISEAEEAHLMKSATFYNISQRPEDTQRRLGEAREHLSFGADAESSSRPRLFAPDQPKIVTEVSEIFTDELHFPTFLQLLQYLAIR